MNKVNVVIENKAEFNFQKEFDEILENLGKYFKINKDLIVDVTITDNKKIQKLNKQYRGKDYPTDILSFDFGDKTIYDSLPILPIGELVISSEKVESQAEEFNHSVRREYCYLFTHGLVHLMGYDHETEEEREEMNNIVDEIFNPLNITRED
ncbi:rRNA maturation RNase YbeY [Mycoplasma sp. Mirounga ES2805-ORL]|uniref:rRNA maturation RNase YbeY n=1 Tax=Mycoplasma sp. Mirounga ES2805-ORL TaxID=754514 RepID=UPI00197BEE9A|nr:rRNA maturation RNase YbeY [Mycoplasma sp. Mirounga ES2805-ORL]QSF13474.1 rRNA maturation RNase YbeY [Mycoplasma sp. Mirounga ES2805-ORL]